MKDGLPVDDEKTLESCGINFDGPIPRLQVFVEKTAHFTQIPENFFGTPIPADLRCPLSGTLLDNPIRLLRAPITVSKSSFLALFKADDDDDEAIFPLTQQLVQKGKWKLANRMIRFSLRF